MKKIVVLFIVVLMVFGIVGPVQASNVPVKQVLIYGPSTVLVGQVFSPSIVITGNGRANVVFDFPKNVVAAVAYYGGEKLTRLENENSILFYPSKVLKPRQSYWYTFAITTRGDLNTGPANWVRVQYGKTVTMGMITITKPIVSPVLKWNIAIPMVAVGYKPYTAYVTANNPSSEPVVFDVMVKVLFEGGCDKSATPKFSGGEMYWSRGDYTGYEIYWRGTVPAHGSYTLSIETASGQNVGTFNLIYFKDLKNPSVTPTTGVVTVVP